MTSSIHLSLIFILLCSSSVKADWIECGPARSFELDLENNQKLFVIDAEIKVKYERNELAVYDYSDLDVVNILINNTAINFTGHTVTGKDQLDPNAFKTSRILNSRIVGSAKLVKSNSNGNTLKDCNLYLSKNDNEEDLNIHNKLQSEIFNDASACIKSIICPNLGVILPNDMKRAKDHPFEFGSLSVVSSGNVQNNFARTIASTFKAIPTFNTEKVKSVLSDTLLLNSDEGGLQSTINTLVDVIISRLVERMRAENHGTINVPDLSQDFSTGSSFWKSTGEFQTFNGTFEDLTTLSRTQDANLSHTGLKFVASCGFGLAKANLKYQKYKLRYGIIKVSGELSAIIDGVQLGVTIVVDYSQKPCRTTLQDLQVANLGKLKIKLTGLSPLNNLLSKLITWITKKWQDEILGKIKSKLMGLIVQILGKFDCEKFRP